MRQCGQELQALRLNIPESPVCDLHLAVGPVALILPDQVFQVFFFIAPNDMRMLQQRQRGNTFIRERTAQTIITGKNKLADFTASCVIEYRVQRRNVTMDV